MPSRQYDVEAEPIIPEGFWPGQPLEAGPSRTDLEQLLLDAAVVLERIGGTFSIVSLRQELIDANNRPTGLFATVGYRAKWESFAPAARAEPAPATEPEPQSEPEPEPVPEAVPVPEPDPGDFGPDPEAESADLFADDFGPDAEEALRERAVAAAAE